MMNMQEKPTLFLLFLQKTENAMKHFFVFCV